MHAALYDFTPIYFMLENYMEHFAKFKQSHCAKFCKLYKSSAINKKKEHSFNLLHNSYREHCLEHMEQK